MPYGAETDPSIIQNGQKRNPIKKSFSVLFNCSKHPGFFGFSLQPFLYAVLLLMDWYDFIPFCADNNIGIVVASSYLAIIGLFNFMGSIGSGWLADKFDNYKLLAAFYSVRGLSLVYLTIQRPRYLLSYSLGDFFGLDFIATIPPTGRFSRQIFWQDRWSDCFCLDIFNSYWRRYGAGRTRDIFLTYEPVFSCSGNSMFYCHSPSIRLPAYASIPTHIFKLKAPAKISRFTEFYLPL